MTARRPRVAIVQRVVRRYRLPFLDSLRAELDERGIELAFVHNTPENAQDRRRDVAELSWAHRTSSWDLGVAGKSVMWQAAPRGLFDADLVVVEQANRLLLNYRLLLRRRLGGPKVALWGHGDNPHPDGSSIAEALKRLYSTQPDWWFAYTDGVADLVEGFGFPRERITSVNNSTDTRRLMGDAAAVTDEDVQRFRDEHDIRGEHIGLYAGALLPEKRLDYLLEAADAVRGALPDFELVIVGDGPLAPWIAEQADQRPWMHYLGQRFGGELARVMRLSSVLMVPTWVGLVIVDGFAAARPLLTRASAAHGPEIEYLRHGENGYLIDDDGDPRRYAEAVVAILSDAALLGRLREGCRRDAQRMGTEEMARRFADGIEAALAAPPRGC
jgi:L-malate glycosyltransferase